ncbi:MAG: carboxylesterase/lipase family protein [Povalibacter sp.]
MLFVRERPIVQVTGGLVRGVSSVEGTKLFRSIPFAQPPFGELRWKPPMSPLPWSGVRDVAGNAPPCLQARFGWNDSLADESSEDCLYLQVRTPRLDPSAKLPVMVWIHGGGNQAGAGRGYARSHIARRGVVLVMLQYRLGVFGFISHPELTAESPDAASGNYALQDQIAALEWVRDNIAAFGGDPANVTVFGQSAGAQDVGLLLVSPLSKDLFSKAIAQSGTATFGTMPRTLEENENIGKELARLAGAAGIAELRRKSGAEILRAAQSLAEPGAHDPSSLWLRAVIDGWVIRESPSATLASSKQRRVPLITGNNSRELPLRGGASQAQSAIEAAFREKAPQAMKLYGLEPGAMVSDDQTMQIATDITFRCPALHMAEMYAAAGVPVWHYEFAMTSDANGVHHSSELPFVFYDTPINGPAQPAVSLQDYWTQFARSGDPNSAELPDWPTFDAQHRSLYVGTSGPRVVPDLRHEICSLLPRS